MFPSIIAVVGVIITEVKHFYHRGSFITRGLGRREEEKDGRERGKGGTERRKVGGM